MSSSSPYMNNINNSSASSHHHNNNQDYGSGGGGDLMLLDGGAAPGGEAAIANSHPDHPQQMFLDGGEPAMLAVAAALDEDNCDDSEEDTEEASETEMGSSSNHRNADEPIEIKEQMYQDKLATLKKQLEELRSGTHPEYVRRVKKLEHQYSERIRLNEIYREYLISCVERDYILEKNAAVKEYEEKKVDLRENLMTDFEDRRKMIETERATMELTGDSVDVKPTITRKLRRRPNEPLPVPEKRRKPTTGQLVLLLDEKEVENDLKLISRGKAAQAMRNHQQQQQQQQTAANGSASGGGAAGSSQTSVAAINSNNTSSSVAAGQQSNSSSVPPSSSASIVNNSYQMNNSSAISAVPTPSAVVTSNSNELVSLPPSSQPTPAQSNAISSAPSQGPPQNQQPQQQQQPPQSQSNSQPSSTTNGQQQQQQQPQCTPAATSAPNQQPLVETRIEDGKLLYERRWFHRGQPVYVEGRDIQRFSANISAIGSEAIWVKKTSDGQKVRIFTNQLSRGKVSIKRRAN